MNDRDDEKLERLIERAFSGLPPRRAPDTLQRRVMDEIAQRAAAPWWRRGFAQWPAAARTGFVIVCLLLAGLSLTSGLTQQLGTQLGTQTLSWAQPFVGLMTFIGGVATFTASLVPLPVIYLALSVGALLYALLFGLGAFAYRTLYLQHSNTAIMR
jgi:hypothetical protein